MILKEVANLPSAFTLLKNQLFKDKKPLLFLDFDGTLAPLVNNPEDAKMSFELSVILKDLADKIPCTILSGRDRSDIEKRVGINKMIYAGSHGFDIKGPDIDLIYQQGVEVLPNLDSTEKELCEELGSIPGIAIERKKFAIAVHYRNVEENKVANTIEEVKRIVKKNPVLKTGEGKMIIEVKPACNWNKGEALLWLFKKLDLSSKFIPVFIGDDVTDEDGFRSIKDFGYGILVGDTLKNTHAEFVLKDTEEVKLFLSSMSKLL